MLAPATTTATRATRSKPAMTSLLSFLRRDDTGLFEDLLNAPAATLRSLRARVDALKDATAFETADWAESVGIEDWPVCEAAMQGEDYADVMADRRKGIALALKDARRRLAAAEFLINTKI